MKGGWIKLEKSLYGDPRIAAMALKLAEQDKASGLPQQPYLRLLVTCVGAVGKLWSTADEHIDESDVLPFGAANIDQLVGIEGFCQLLPSEWFQVIDAHSVKLFGYHAHNGTQARKKLNGANRQQVYRSRHASPKRHR
jgi:hypothetical protein